MSTILCFFFFLFFFNDTATTEIYTLSLHDALPIFTVAIGSLLRSVCGLPPIRCAGLDPDGQLAGLDRKSTRLNSSHANISYAVFCLKKKKKKNNTQHYYKLQITADESPNLRPPLPP